MNIEETNTGMQRVNILEQTTARLDERTNAMKEWMKKIETGVTLLDQKLDTKIGEVQKEVSNIWKTVAGINGAIGVMVILVIKYWT